MAIILRTLPNKQKPANTNVRKITNAMFWKNYFESVFFSQINIFQNFFLQKVLPSFDSIETEAQEITEKEYERLGSLPSSGDDVDMAALAEQATDEGSYYYSAMHDLKDGMVGFFCVGLYHLFEQQLYFFYRKEILPIHDEDNDALFSRKKLNGKFKEKNISLEELKSYKKLNLLELVCNTIKHAEGRSAQALRKLKPSYFQYKESPKLVLTGQDIKIPVKDFIGYCKTVNLFWKELGEKLTK